MLMVSWTWFDDHLPAFSAENSQTGDPWFDVETAFANGAALQVTQRELPNTGLFTLDEAAGQTGSNVTNWRDPFAETVTD